MVFSSVLFTFLFLPIVILVYFVSKENFKNIWLLIASLVFYAVGEPKAVFLMIASIIVNYAFGLILEKREGKTRRLLLAADIVLNLSVLVFFKYMNLVIGTVNALFGQNFNTFKNISLPIGISFFTFQAMSYVIDVYRGEVKAEKNVLNVGLYIAFFPQLIAGPIVRYSTIAQQIKSRNITFDSFSEGVKRFMLGFSKKIILANHLAVVADATMGAVMENPEYVYQIPIVLAWFGSLCYTLQIFFDFSAYSDMAIGLGKMFGFQFEENFNYPYISKSITEFWRRWHISLSRWFRDYVYIPLGGSRKGSARQILNLFIVWFLTGLWHGAAYSFIAWGMFYFIFLIFEKFVLKPAQRNSFIKYLWMAVSLLAVNFGWVLFNMESLQLAAQYIKAMLGGFSTAAFDSNTWHYLREYGIYAIAGIIFSTPIAPFLKKKLTGHKIYPFVINAALPIAYLLMFLWSISFLILGAHNPFIYFNF